MSDDTRDDGVAATEAPIGQTMPDGLRGVIAVDEGKVQSHLDRVVRETVEQTLNALLDAEADELCGAKRYQRSADRVDTRAGVGETLTYLGFPRGHWRRIRTNNLLERLMKEIRRRTRVVGAFPDGRSAVMLAAARLRHVAGTDWGERAYLDMKLLREQDVRTKTAGDGEDLTAVADRTTREPQAVGV